MGVSNEVAKVPTSGPDNAKQFPRYNVVAKYFQIFILVNLRLSQNPGNTRDLKRSHWLPLAKPSWTKEIGFVFNIFKEGDSISLCCFALLSLFCTTFSAKIYFLSAIYAYFHFLYYLLEESTKLIKNKVRLALRIWKEF